VDLCELPCMCQLTVSSNSERPLQKLQEWGNRYYQEHLDEKYRHLELETNWWKAIEFFFGRTFYRGRRDKLSNEYQTFAVSTLREHFGVADGAHLQPAASKLWRERSLFGADWIIAFKARHHLGKGNALKHRAFTVEVSARNPIVRLLTTVAETPITWDGDCYSRRCD